MRVKHILQNPNDKNDMPQAITGLVATGNIDSPRKTGPTRPVISIITSTMYKNEVAKEEMICSKPEISVFLARVNTGKESPLPVVGIVVGGAGVAEAEGDGLVIGEELGLGEGVGVTDGDGLGVAVLGLFFVAIFAFFWASTKLSKDTFRAIIAFLQKGFLLVVPPELSVGQFFVTSLIYKFANTACRSMQLA
jgi:hypothetical protein